MFNKQQQCIYLFEAIAPAAVAAVEVAMLHQPTLATTIVSAIKTNAHYECSQIDLLLENININKKKKFIKIKIKIT